MVGVGKKKKKERENIRGNDSSNNTSLHVVIKKNELKERMKQKLIIAFTRCLSRLIFKKKKIFLFKSTRK
jgi:hypothetical protein